MKMARVYLGTASAAMAICLATAAAAQPVSQTAATASDEATTDTAATGEIIVTAQRRSESVQKIPLAVSAIGGAALQQRGDTSLAGLGQVVPGLNISEQIGQARLTLRGVILCSLL